jgi:hypothetical protein
MKYKLEYQTFEHQTITPKFMDSSKTHEKTTDYATTEIERLSNFNC